MRPCFFSRSMLRYTVTRWTPASIFCSRSRIWSTSRCCLASSITCRMTRRCRVSRMPSRPTACCNLPVVSAVLSRSPVETRCADEAAMLRSPDAGRSAGLGMRRQQPHDVIVHNVGKQDQEKHQSDLDEALLECETQVSPHEALDGQEQNVPSVEDWNGQQVQDSQVNANQYHYGNHCRWAFADCFAGNARNPNGALELLHGNAPAEEFSNHSHGILDHFEGSPRRRRSARCKAHPLIRDIGIGSNTDLIVVSARLGYALFGRYSQMQDLSIALDIKLQGLATGVPDVILELVPVFNLLAVHSPDDVLLAQPCPVGGRPREGISDDCRYRQIAKNPVNWLTRVHGDLHVPSYAVIFNFQLEDSPGGVPPELIFSLLPGRILHIVDGDNRVTRLQRRRSRLRVCWHASDLHRLAQERGGRHARHHVVASQ